MAEKKRKCESANDTQRLKARMAARRRLESKDRAPSLLCVFVSPESKNQCDSEIAQVDGRELRRADGESLEEFTQRVEGEMPVNRPGLGILWPADSPTVNATREREGQ
jgi:hypothetical protein